MNDPTKIYNELAPAILQRVQALTLWFTTKSPQDLIHPCPESTQLMQCIAIVCLVANDQHSPIQDEVLICNCIDLRTAVNANPTKLSLHFPLLGAVMSDACQRLPAMSKTDIMRELGYKTLSTAALAHINRRVKDGVFCWQDLNQPNTQHQMRFYTPHVEAKIKKEKKKS